ncbi:MAG TPA: ABC transporter ATP-binding protein [Spongiibacteraceae bacterium]|nr:ABC transporter ATP-binding protein [Spongiibacteraceae bacterium]HUH37207.1 ABC transporter ATP-binding protein [Spongiibacteraceae bacterium]
MLTLDNIQCRLDNQVIVDHLSLHVSEGDIACLLGSSGGGKTTVLRAIAGFQPIARGEIRLDDVVISQPGRQLPPEQRRIGMVFQDFALFPHLNVFDNIAFGIRRLPAARQRQSVGQLLEMVKLTGLERRHPHELSGGQQQRVALARAMATSPRLLLLDEPFSNLDVDLRKRLSLEVRDILKEYGTSAILVTHDQDEAFAFGDRIGLLGQGHLQQWDTPFGIYHEPCNRLVADFIGQGCFVPGLTLSHTEFSTELGVLRGNRAYSWPRDTPVEVLLRPDDIVLDETGQGLQATVVKKVFSGGATLYTLRLPTGSLVEALLPSHRDFPEGDRLPVAARIEHLIVFRQESG